MWCLHLAIGIPYLLYLLQCDHHSAGLTLDVSITVIGNRLNVNYVVSDPATCTCQLDSGTPVACTVTSFVCVAKQLLAIE